MAGDYQARLERVYARIHADPAGDLSLDELAAVAALSRFHFHRIFTAMTGETLAEAVRRIRLNRAAHALWSSRAPVAGIARAHGYPNPGSFSRAFRAAFGQTPAAFRRAGAALPARLRRPPGTGDPPMFPVTLSDEPARRVIGADHRGPYDRIGAAFARLGAVLGPRNLWPRTRGVMVGVSFDDPGLVPAAELRGLAGVDVGPDLPCPEGLSEIVLPGGPYAVMTYRGPYPGIAAAYDWLYGDWLRASGRAPREAPGFEIYRNSPAQAAPEDLRTDIFLPLEG